METELLKLENIFNSYKKVIELIEKHGYIDFKDFCDSIYEEIAEEFISVIKKGEKETLNFILNN
mgnify:CR=1 FL=1